MASLILMPHLTATGRTLNVNGLYSNLTFILNLTQTSFQRPTSVTNQSTAVMWAVIINKYHYKKRI